MTSETKNPFRCFDSRFLRTALIAGLAIVGLALLGRQWERGTPVRIAFGFLEAGVFTWITALTLLSLRRLDELQQRIHLIAIAVSFGVAGVLATGQSFLAKSGLSVPEPGLWLWPLMTVVWGVGVVALSRRYR